MPYIHVKTSLSVDERLQTKVQQELGQAIGLLPGKSEQWLMVQFSQEQTLWMAGSDEPAAMVEVSIYGGAPQDAYDQLTERITNILYDYLDLEPQRVYVKYAECEVWGWNGANF